MINQEIIPKVAEEAKKIKYSLSYSEELIRLLAQRENEKPEDYRKRITKTLEESPEKFPQIHPEVKKFLRQTLEKEKLEIQNEEFKALLLALLSSPKPDQQLKILEENQEFLNKETSRAIKNEIIRYLQIEEALEKAWPWQRLEYFAAITPDERKQEQSQEQIQKALEEAEPGKRLYYFFRAITPDERKQEQSQEQIQKALEKAWPWELLAYFAAITPDERKQEQSQEQIQKALEKAEPWKEVEPWQRLEYFAAITPDERKQEQSQEQIQKALEEAWPGQRLYYFFRAITPDERKQEQSQEQIQKALEEAEPGQRLYYFGAITPDERKQEQSQEQIQKALEKAEPGDRLYYFGAITPDERKQEQSQEQIQKVLEEVELGQRLAYFGAITPDERKEYQEQIQKDLEEAEPWQRLAYFFRAITPDERKEYQEQIQKDLEEAEPWQRLEYFGAITPDERKQEQSQEQIQKALEEAEPGQHLEYFGAITPDERSLSPKAKELCSKIESRLTSEIGDIGLRKEYFRLLRNYLSREDSSLIALNELSIPRGRLSLFLGLEALGANTLAGLSWELDSQQYLDLLYILSRLSQSKENKGLLEGIYLPFRPRDKKVDGFEEPLIEWFRSLDFLNSLGPLLNSRTILEDHLKFIRERQKKERIETASTKIKLSFLEDEEIAEKLRSLKKIVKDNFQNLLDLQELLPQKFEEFIQNWQGEIESIVVLASRLHQAYPEVKALLSKIVSAEIEGKFSQLRYDLKDSLTKKQLSPLIKGKDEEEVSKILEDYHKGTILVWEEEEKEDKRKEKEAVFILKEELKENLVNNFLTHHHFQEIFNLEEFNNLTPEEKEKLEKYILAAFLPKEEVPLKNPEELRSDFQGKVKAETLTVIIKLNQFFKDLNSGQKSAEDLSRALNNILKSLPPEMQELGVIKNDLGEFLKAALDAASETKEAQVKRRILLAHTTDHPKTLLEIGKYPANSGSCQSYDYSNLELAKSLLGYVFDAHIQAIVIREIETQEDIEKVVALDEGRRTVKIRTKDNQEKEVRVGKPIARAMIFLGEKDGQGIFVLQPNYFTPGAIEPSLARELQKKTLATFINDLNNNHNFNFRQMQPEERGIIIAGSHNPEGHYNDLKGGQVGQEKESYIL
jgi:hypothetical protein